MMLAVIGLVDAAYLTYKHYSGSSLMCNISQGCEQVLTSQYAVVAGVPVALLGVLFYATVLLTSVYFLTNKPGPKLMLLLGLAGFIPTLYLLYLQAFVIRAWCQYCLLSALTSTAIFVMALFLVSKKLKGQLDAEEA